MAALDARQCGLPPSLENLASESNMTLQKIQRIRVNRVAIIQALRVEHILNHLIDSGVLSEDNKKEILTSKTAQDKARTLIDLLPKKYPGKHRDWYGQFKEALKNPETRSKDVKKKYEMLIDFLDNTIIHMPRPVTPISKSDSEIGNRNFPRYSPLPGIGDRGMEKGLSEAPEHRNKDGTTEKGYIPKPDNFASIIKVPREHFTKLQSSDRPEDKLQLEKEELALDRLKRVEILYAVDKRGLLPQGFEISTSDAMVEFLSDTDLYPMYLKYLLMLKLERRMDMLGEIAGSFINFATSLEDADDEEMREKLTDIGFGLYDMMLQSGNLNKAELIILGLMSYLSKNSQLENWMALYEGCTRMMAISNENLDFQQTSNSYHLVTGLANKIHNMSFGQDLLDESRMYSAMSMMMREQGSMQPALSWANKAIKEVEEENKHEVVDVLCTASLAYTCKWNIKKAEALAIEAVKFARASFGTQNPTYVKALLHYVYYSNEFRQDEMGVEVARVALSICEQIYGGSAFSTNYQMALVHQALAKALIVNKQFDGEEYLQHALNAYRAAIDVIPGSHPRLGLFSYTLAQCLQWRAMHQENPTDKKESLIWAESEAKTAQKAFKTFWGEYSIKALQADCLLGQIHTKLDDEHFAKLTLMAAYNTCKQSMSPTSNYMALIHGTLGTFYKTLNKPQESIEMLEKAVEHVDCGGVYLEWVHTCYETLVSQLRATGADSDAEKYQAGLVDWMKKNPKPNSSVSWKDLHAAPKSLDEFRQGFFSAQTKFKAAKKGLKNLKMNLANVKTEA